MSRKSKKSKKRSFDEADDVTSLREHRAKRPPSETPSLPDHVRRLPDLVAPPRVDSKQQGSDSTAPTFEQQVEVDLMQIRVGGEEHRINFVIEQLVQSAIRRGWPESKASNQTSPVLSFIDSAFQRLLSNGCERGRALAARDRMLKNWGDHLAGCLGSSIGSNQDLARILDRIIHEATRLQAFKVDPALRTALNSIILDTQLPFQAHGVQYTPSFDSSTGQNPDNIRVQALPAARDRHSEARQRLVGANDDRRTLSKNDTLPVQTETADPTTQSNRDRSSEKFSSCYSFYFHHARKAKKKHVGTERYKAEKSKLKDEIECEWAGLSRQKKGSWEKIYRRVLEGDANTISDDIDHLLSDGRGSSIPSKSRSSDEGYSSAHPSSSSTAMVAEDTPEVERPSFPPLEKGFHPVTTPYKSPKPGEAKHVVWFRAKHNRPLSPAEITVALRRTPCTSKFAREVGHVRSYDANKDLFLIVAKNIRTARQLTGKLIDLRGEKVKLRNYSAVNPKAFTFTVRHSGPVEVIKETIFPSLVELLKKAKSYNNAVHLRVEESPKDNTWTNWVVQFKQCPRQLRFILPIWQKNGSRLTTHFFSVTKEDGCSVCNGFGHAMWECDFLRPVTAEELGISRNEPQFLAEKPFK
ncbi:hypothetical protein KC343_g4997 [Hortaea werneckii]|nr:hypothetical protein KC343_g4997 [Hortaea werneckii]